MAKQLLPTIHLLHPNSGLILTMLIVWDPEHPFGGGSISMPEGTGYDEALALAKHMAASYQSPTTFATAELVDHWQGQPLENGV